MKSWTQIEDALPHRAAKRTEDHVQREGERGSPEADSGSETLPTIETDAGQLLKDAPRDELFPTARAAADGRTVSAGPRSTAHDRTDSPDQARTSRC